MHEALFVSSGFPPSRIGDAGRSSLARSTPVPSAFEPLLNGARGKIHFDGEDFFAEVENDKVMANWRLHMEVNGKQVSMRGLDLLHFEGDRLVRKLAYCKSASPTLD